MAAVKEALALATEVDAMLDCMMHTKFGCDEAVIDFMDWAIEEHVYAGANDLGLDAKSMNELLQWAEPAIEKQDTLIVALPLFRYWLQAYKSRFDLSAAHLDALAIINRVRVNA